MRQWKTVERDKIVGTRIAAQELIGELVREAIVDGAMTVELVVGVRKTLSKIRKSVISPFHDAGDRRISGGKRVEVNQPAKLIRSDRYAFDIRLVDISRKGFRFRHDAADLDVGELVDIQSGRQCEVRGQIHWTNAREAGGTFIDLAEEID